MSTHNIGLYEDLTKIIFKLSSNIIKYAPYFFYWSPASSQSVLVSRVSLMSSNLSVRLEVLTICTLFAFYFQATNKKKTSSLRAVKTYKRERVGQTDLFRIIHPLQ